MKKFYIFGFLFVITVFIMAIQKSSTILLFIDVISFLFTVIFSIILMRGIYSFREMLSYFSIAFRNNSTDKKEINDGITFFNTLQSILIFAGIITFIVGMVCFIASFEEPEAIGAALATAILAVLYSLGIIMIVVIPFRAGLKRMLNSVS